MMDDDEYEYGDPSDTGEYMARCPVCDEYIQYCQGHGEIGDYAGWRILQMHGDDDHSKCHWNSDCSEEVKA